MSPAAPVRGRVWLAAPTRFALLTRRRARLAAAAVALLLALSLTALGSAAPPAVTVASDAAGEADNRADVLLYQDIVAAMQRGEPYYPAAAEALRRGGYPLRPFVTFRLPTLAVLESSVPWWGVIALLYALALIVAAAWLRRLERVFARPLPRLVALLLLAAGAAPVLRPDMAAFHEVWAGLLIALSLGTWQRGAALPAIALGTCAMLIRETSALYVLAMATAATIDRRWREAVGWAAGAALLAVAVAAHAHAVALVVRPLDTASPGWSGMLGPGFFITTVRLATALSVLPAAVAVLLVALSLVGWAGWRTALGTRALATLLLYAALIAGFARVDTYYWVLLIAPISLVGLVFAPDAIADLWRAAVDRRRVTVTWSSERAGQ